MEFCTWEQIIGSAYPSEIYQVDCLESGGKTKKNRIKNQFIGEYIQDIRAKYFHYCPFCGTKILLTHEVSGGE